LAIQAELYNRTQHLSLELTQRYEEERLQTQHLANENEDLRAHQEQLKETINEQSAQLMHNDNSSRDLAAEYHS
jgi:hypothetical protein